MAANSTTAGAVTAAVGRALPPHVVRVFGDPRFRLDGDLLALAIAPDGTAWSLEEPGLLRHWNLAGGQLLSRLELSDLEEAWAFSPDARLLASGSDTLSLWDSATGDLHRSFPPTAWTTCIAFRPDGKALASGHDDNCVRIWDARTGRCTAELFSHVGPVSAIAFSPDGTKLASAAEDRTICIWDVKTGQALGRWKGHNDRIQALAWHPQGRRLVSAGWDTTARVWDAITFEPVILLNGHADQVTALAFSPDGRLLATADSAFAVWLWDVEKGKPRHVLKGHASEVARLAFSPDGQRLLSGGQDRRLILWDANAGQILAGPGRQAAPLAQTAAVLQSPRLSLSPDGRRLACVTGGSRVCVWDTGTGACVLDIVHPDRACTVCFRPDGRWLATGDTLGKVHLWDAASGKALKTIDGHHGAITSLAFSADGQTLASAGGTDGYVYLWSMKNFEPVLLVPEATGKRGTVETVAFHPLPHLLVTGGLDWTSTKGTDGIVTLWDVVQRRLTGSLTSGAAYVVLRPDGKQLAAAAYADSVSLWDVETRTLTHELHGDEGLVTCLAYSRDGRLLATGSDDGALMLWRSDTGQRVQKFELDTAVKDLVFAPDGLLVYTANGDGTGYAVEVGVET